MKLLIVYLSIIAIVLASDWDDFIRYKNEFQKNYESISELKLRFSYFQKNMRFIKESNAMNKSYTLGWTSFTDWNNNEFKNYVNMYKSPEFITCNESYYNNESYPIAIDWRNKGIVTNVKDQGWCGSCWAFSTTGSLEGLLGLAVKKTTSLSEEQLIDCSYNYGNDGCNGGLIINSFAYVIANGGLCSEKAYPYDSSMFDYNTCLSYNCSSVPYTNIKKCYTIIPKNEAALGYYISHQPISAGIQADSMAFQNYVSGIFDDKDCYRGAINHAITIVGYNDTDKNSAYYILKNSWGEKWGEKGYMKLGRNPNGTDVGICGITLRSSYPSY